MVRYIIEHYNDIISLLNNEDKIKELEMNILEICIEYYNSYFKIDKIKQEFYDIETPNELMDYMNKNIIYGWLDKQNNEHVDNLIGFRENYKISSIKEIIDTGLGTCIEQAKLIKYFFDKIGLENKLYCYRRYETEENFDKDVRMHCFVLFYYQNNWYRFEHSIPNLRGIHKYVSLENAINYEIDRHDENNIRELVEIPDIPDGLTFKQFNQYINSFEPISSHESHKKI